MVKECIDGFLAAGLETGLGKTFWTSSTHSPNTHLKSVRARNLLDRENHFRGREISHMGEQ